MTPVSYPDLNDLATLRPPTVYYDNHVIQNSARLSVHMTTMSYHTEYIGRLVAIIW
jgi:hypothetical protein